MLVSGAWPAQRAAGAKPIPIEIGETEANHA